MDGEISIIGLGRLEAAELQQELGQGVIQESTALTPDKQGELVTVALIVSIVPSIIGLIGLWVSRPQQRKRISVEVVVKDKDGNERKETISYDEYSSGPPSKTVAEAFGKVLQTPAKKIEELIKQAEEAAANP